MSSFRGLTADRKPLDEFERRASLFAATQRGRTSTGITLDLFEWRENAAQGVDKCDLKSVQELESESEGAVRVIFAPRDTPAPGTTEALIELFDTCSIPSAFVDESLRAVSQSFAAREDLDGSMCIWFHLLCNTLAIPENTNAPAEAAEGRKTVQPPSRTHFTWLKPGIVLRIRKPSTTLPKPVRTSTSDSDDTLAAIPVKARVELVCFGAPSTLHDRIRALTASTTCDELLNDPYVLLEIVFEEMYKILDWTAWAIADTFGPLETQISGIASKPGKAAEELPKHFFTELHTLTKHTLYLRENCEAALATLNDLYSHHKVATGESPEMPQSHTRQALKYRKTLFESTQRRLASLNARLSNIIEMSFNIVTQGDSKLMQSENQSMKTIAVMTLVFMPLGTVASIFGSQFMKLQDERPYRLTVSRDFWLMWVIAIPLTAVVLTSKCNSDAGPSGG
ncbi:hypothetical protein AA0120_g11948 [Alternaria tenuissima]|nr:hypothetical protein AA0120_g11948 [Alternaria tenuissima]